MATIYPPRHSLMSYLRVGDNTPGTSEKGTWSVRPAQHAVGHDRPTSGLSFVQDSGWPSLVRDLSEAPAPNPIGHEPAQSKP